MPGEYMTEYNDNTISAAIEHVEENWHNIGFIGNYIELIQEAYEQQLHGTAELSRMVRAAQLITDRRPGDVSAEVQAVYHGELLAYELINNLEPGVGVAFKTGFAQSFIVDQLEQSRQTFIMEQKDPTNQMGPSETRLHQSARFSQLSRKLQQDLSPPSDIRELNPLFIEFGEKATYHLTDDPYHQTLGMMGFRMILTEALSPSTRHSTGELIEFVNRMTNNAGLKEKPSILDLEKNHRPSDHLLEDIVNEPEDLEWENISHYRKNILKKYIKFRQAFSSTALSDDTMNVGITRLIETQLQEFNRRYELINPKDLLSVTGEFFAIGRNQEGESDTFLYTQKEEIRGMFDGIHLVEAPSNNSLLRTVSHPEKYIEEMNRPKLLSPAIRIVDPVFLTYTADGSEITGYGTGLTVDIPLTYKTVVYERIKAETTLENEV